jgi:hypothetical protein
MRPRRPPARRRPPCTKPFGRNPGRRGRRFGAERLGLRRAEGPLRTLPTGSVNLTGGMKIRPSAAGWRNLGTVGQPLRGIGILPISATARAWVLPLHPRRPRLGWGASAGSRCHGLIRGKEPNGVHPFSLLPAVTICRAPAGSRGPAQSIRARRWVRSPNSGCATRSGALRATSTPTGRAVWFRGTWVPFRARATPGVHGGPAECSHVPKGRRGAGWLPWGVHPGRSRPPLLAPASIEAGSMHDQPVGHPERGELPLAGSEAGLRRMPVAAGVVDVRDEVAQGERWGLWSWVHEDQFRARFGPAP